MNIRDCVIRRNHWFKNCRRRRKERAQICFECPIREDIERIEQEEGYGEIVYSKK